MPTAVRPSKHSRHIGRKSDGDIISATLVLRRRPGHDPIPQNHEFIGCPPRERLSNEEFAARYGADPDDIEVVREYCRSQGLHVDHHHGARRHVVVRGSVAQINALFQTELHDYYRLRPFHFPHNIPVVPDHLTDIIVHVGLGEEPRTPTAFTPPNWTNKPPNTPQGGTASATSPPQVATLYNCPNDGTGQTIAIIVETITADGTVDDGSGLKPNTGEIFGYSRSDVQLTLQAWGVPMPTIIDIAVDGTHGNSNTPAGEWTGDIVVAAGFAKNAQIAVYFQGNATDFIGQVYGRIIHPNPGDPVCYTASLSATRLDEAQVIGFPSYVAAVEAMLQDAALQGVTILMPSGDYGSGGGIGDGKSHCTESTYEQVLCVGGTTLGNINNTAHTFQEWLWSQSVVGAEASYLVGAGGGTSVFIPKPSYQMGYNVPVSLNNGFVGRGIPDVAAIASQEYTIYQHGAVSSFSGTSQSLPSVNGMLASINKALGRPVGYLNPTLYAGGNSVVRDINPTTSAGGPQTNANGFNLSTSTIVPNTPGYPVTNGFDCCTGLGVLNGNALINFISYPGTGTANTHSLDQFAIAGGNPITAITKRLNDGHRKRAATIGPDGLLYYSTSDGDGRGSQSAGTDVVNKIDVRAWTQTPSASAVELAFVNNVVWYEDSAGNWYSFVVTSGVPSIASGPTATSPLPLSTTFLDDFITLPLHLSWQAGDNWQLIAPDSSQTIGRGGPTWNEAGTQWWVNPFNPNTPVSGLYNVVSEQLNLTLTNTPAAVQSYINSQAGATMPYVGALLNSSQTLYQRFGYFDFSAAVPRIPGFAFQFNIENVQITGHWPPEIDILIFTDGSNVQTVQLQVALPSGGYARNTSISSSSGFDASLGHIYGLDWQTDNIRFYIDGALRWTTPNPGGVYQSDRQFIYLVTYANYPSGVNPSPSSLPATVRLGYVRVYQNKP